MFGYSWLPPLPLSLPLLRLRPGLALFDRLVDGVLVRHPAPAEVLDAGALAVGSDAGRVLAGIREALVGAQGAAALGPLLVRHLAAVGVQKGAAGVGLQRHDDLGQDLRRGHDDPATAIEPVGNAADHLCDVRRAPVLGTRGSRVGLTAVPLAARTQLVVITIQRFDCSTHRCLIPSYLGFFGFYVRATSPAPSGRRRPGAATGALRRRHQRRRS